MMVTKKQQSSVFIIRSKTNLAKMWFGGPKGFENPKENLNLHDGKTEIHSSNYQYILFLASFVLKNHLDFRL